MKLFSWFLIGRIALEVWLSLFPDEQARRVAIATVIFCEQQQCHKVVLDIQVTDKEVYFFALCKEVET